jgi:hypothetical protein
LFLLPSSVRRIQARVSSFPRLISYDSSLSRMPLHFSTKNR